MFWVKKKIKKPEVRRTCPRCHYRLYSEHLLECPRCLEHLPRTHGCTECGHCGVKSFSGS